MKTKFYKYHGTGNDFILLDNRDGTYSDLNTEQRRFLCNRHFGIGADGLMLLNNSENHDFEMKYYNSDGSESSMCGNGGRCIVGYAKRLGMISDYAIFSAIDGVHRAYIDKDNIVKLKLNDVDNINLLAKDFKLDTGSPQYVRFVKSVNEVNVYNEGSKIRYDKQVSLKGVNVNFVEIKDENRIQVRTYERGVENETLSCGTGAVASAIIYSLKNNLSKSKIDVNTKGGELTVFFESINNKYSEIWLQGPSKFVYEGTIDMKKDK